MNKIYYFLIPLLTLIIGAKSELKSCSILDTFQWHLNLTKEKFNDVSEYIPKSSCLLCTKLKCDVKDPKCNRISSSEILYIYNNMLEFGFYYYQFPVEFRANVRITNDCGFQLYVRRPKDNERVDDLPVEWRECRKPNFEDCVTVHKYSHIQLNMYKSCMFFTFKFFGPALIYEASTRYCNLSSTNNLNDTKVLPPFQCSFNENTPMTVQFHFVHSETTPEDGIALILPCSPGGYAVDPMTGRFVTGDFCKTVFRAIDGGIDLIIRKFYGGNEHYRFPAYKNAADFVRRIPMYITGNGQGKSPKEMAPSVLDCNFNYIRKGCNAEIQKKSTEEVEKDPRCRKAYEEVFFDVSVDQIDSNDIINVEPPEEGNYDEFSDEVNKRLQEVHRKKDEGKSEVSEAVSGAESITVNNISKRLNFVGLSIVNYLVIYKITDPSNYFY